jgi:plastocyanin
MKLWVSGLLGLAAVGVAAVPPESSGRISGKVTLVDGKAPRPSAQNVVVWIEATPEEKGAARKASGLLPTMTSVRKTFVPRVVAVETGSAVSFPNQDWIYHNVFSVSGDNRFDLGLYRRGKSKEKTFDVPGLVRVYCNIHPQMVGYVRVVDSGFFAVTGPDGSFVFENVPAGERKVRAWCEEGGETSVAVLVRPGSVTQSELSLDVTGFKPETHKNKYGKDYPPPPSDEDRY